MVTEFSKIFLELATMSGGSVTIQPLYVAASSGKFYYILHLHQQMYFTWSHQGKGKSVTVHAVKAYRGTRGTAPLIFNLKQ